jgi:undecaprenyl-diphosphatase
MKRLFTSVFGLGRLPVAPGTWASMPVIIILGLMYHYGVTTQLITIAMVCLALAGSIVCIKFAPAAIAVTGKNDPHEVVADEVAGQAVTFLPVAFTAIHTFSTSQFWIIAVLGFLLFRLFDITKPWPIRKLERFPAGWGILADDLLAGLFAAVVLLLGIKLGVASYCEKLFSFSDNTPLDVPRAVILGIIQGLTEFLPVSSSGHLALFENIFKFNPESPEMLLFDLSVHLGTLVSIFIIFRKSIIAFVKNLADFRRYGKNIVEIYKKNPSVHIFVLAIFATGITGVIGMPLKDHFEAAFGSLTLIASMWLVSGTFLLITDRKKKARLGLREFGFLAAGIVGLAQTVAILPGISRSGATICAAILIGLHRRWAVEFSFLLAIPAISAATLVELIHNFNKISSGSLPIHAVVVGSLAASITGIFALKLLIKTSRQAKLKYFAFYCYILAGLVFLWLI